MTVGYNDLCYRPTLTNENMVLWLGALKGFSIVLLWYTFFCVLGDVRYYFVLIVY